MTLGERVIACRIDSRFAGMTALDFLEKRFTYRDRAGWLERIDAGELTLENEPLNPEDLLAVGMTLRYYPGDLPEPPVDASFRVVLEDQWLLIVDKSGDLPTHPAGIFYKNTLWYLLRERYGAVHLVNRLDRETSGLLIVAKDPVTARKMSKGGFYKEYLALVHGRFDHEIAANGFLTSDPTSIVRKKRRWVSELGASEKGESATTLFVPEAIGDTVSLVRAMPETGRMHQIRATLFSLGYPLLGDKLYGLDDSLYLKQRDDAITEADFERIGMRRQALHASLLRFIHPHSGVVTVCTTEFPLDFVPVL